MSKYHSPFITEGKIWNQENEIVNKLIEVIFTQTYTLNITIRIRKDAGGWIM